MAKDFGVSRTSIREAIKTLAHSGVLESKSGAGTYVSHQALRSIRAIEVANALSDTHSFAGLMETRLIIEPQIAYIATERASSEDIEELEEICRETEAIISGGTYNLNMGFKFHRAIVSITKNAVLINFFDSIADMLTEQREELLRHLDKDTLFMEVDEHRGIVEHMKKGEAAKARDLMHRHLANACKVLSKTVPSK